jgi:hypothetical protein
MSELPGNKLETTIQHSASTTSNHYNGPNQPITTTESVVQHRVAAVVIQHITGTAHLVLVTLHPTLNTKHYIWKIRENYLCALCKTKRSSWSSLFTTSMIGIAQIDQVQEAGWNLRNII